MIMRLNPDLHRRLFLGTAPLLRFLYEIFEVNFYFFIEKNTLVKSSRILSFRLNSTKTYHLTEV